jgi:signal transduction histidine kinase
MAKLKKIVVDGWRRTLVDPVRTQKLNQLVRGFSEQVAIVDEDWTIVAVNDAWKQMVKVAGYPELSPGTDYRLFLKTFAEKGHANAIAVLRGVNAIDHGESDFFQLNYAGVDEWQGRMLQFRINRVHVDGCALATITRYDITDTIELKRLREDFSSSIIQCQAEERGRMARELHDSTTQLLTSVGLLLRTLQHDPLSPKAPGLIEEMQGFLSQAQQEIRSISYLAHAPAIHEMGFLRAVEALSQGFGRRAQLDVTFEVHGTPTPLSSTAENALYRVAQEALSNIHRHAQATHVRIAVAFRKSVTHFVIIDDGIGISHEIFGGRGAAGVGLTGMRLRLSEIGGRLSVCRLSPGTAVIASIQS